MYIYIYIYIYVVLRERPDQRVEAGRLAAQAWTPLIINDSN